MKFLSLAVLLLAPVARAAESTPIKHVVVIFQENVSFDHYFATYPQAENRAGEPAFKARPGTPSVNGLTGPLMTRNPNAAPPFRLDRSSAATCDQDHSYDSEQKAYHGGLLDRFVETTGNGDAPCSAKVVMGYFDGNTVTALWNYAQSYAMSDNFYDSNFGPSTPGALNLAAGNTHGAVPAELATKDEVMAKAGTVIGDPDPDFDDCSSPPTLHLTGRNIGDLLNAKKVSWGFFEAGFRPTLVTPGRAQCGLAHKGADGKEKKDYIPHHEPFQYWQQTSNPHHLQPSAVLKIGQDDQANHQYDLEDFWLAAKAGAVPAVSFLKAPAYQDGHAGYSDPLSEQTFLVETMNRLQALPQWKDMAVIITYDDSDGWYDHVMPPIVRRSRIKGSDALLGDEGCGASKNGDDQGRCGYGPRLPFLLISPYARENYVDHAIIDQASIARFIEDNWGLGRIGGGSYDEDAGSLLAMFDFSKRRADKLVLDPSTGRKAPPPAPVKKKR